MAPPHHAKSGRTRAQERNTRNGNPSKLGMLCSAATAARLHSTGLGQHARGRMRKFHRSLVLTSVSLIAFAFSPPAGAEQPAQAGRHIIPGVPFVRWSEAQKWRYPDKQVTNPSEPAADAMLLRYWGTDASLVERRNWDEALKKQGWHSEWLQASSLAEIRAVIDRNMPVLVLPAMTPFAHRIQPYVAMMAQFKDVKVKVGRAGMLGSWAPLDDLEKYEKHSGTTANISEYSAARLIVGYDQQRKSIFLHDPSLGALWEVPEQEFDSMWRFSKRSYWVLYPPNYQELLAAKSSALPRPYAPRTPDNDAAVHYWYACALESLNSLDRAEQELRLGLKVPGTEKGTEHLLHLELARVLQLRSKKQETVSELRAAIELNPDDPTAWKMLQAAGQSSGEKNSTAGASEAADKLHSLCNPDAQARFVRSLGVEFDTVEVPALGCEQ